jgi:O-antigen/teichoic acid export membrane protein
MLLYLATFSYFDITETGLLAILCASITYLGIVLYPVASRLFIVSDDDNVYREKILQLSMPMMFISGIMFLMGYADTYMIAYFLDVKDSSIYAAIMKLAASITFITSIVITVRAKGIVVCDKNYEKLKAHFRSTSKIILLISLPIVFIVFISGDFLISLYGQEYFSEYAYLLNIYVVAVLINSLPMGYYFVLTDRQNELLKIILVGLVLNIILNYFYIPRFGLDAAVITTLISNAVWNTLAFLYLKFKKVL